LQNLQEPTVGKREGNVYHVAVINAPPYNIKT